MNAMLDDADKMVRTANLLAASAGRMNDRRMTALADRSMDAIAFQANVVDELNLRAQVNAILLAAVDQVVCGAKGAQEDLETAIAQANDRLARIDDIGKALAVFASLLGLGIAVAALKPAPILTALKAVQKSVTAVV
ncbi:MAG: hypothetical protein ABI277_09860 [Burkholderiaceae bacterium]